MGLLSRLGKKLRILGPPPREAQVSRGPATPRAAVVDDEPASPRAADQSARDFIEATVKAHRIVLFMKGTRDAPRCGFSANAAAILTATGQPFHTVDVLADDEIREEVKVYSSWPTLPQVFVGGELVGGSDILAQLQQSGELAQMVADPT